MLSSEERCKRLEAILRKWAIFGKTAHDLEQMEQELQQIRQEPRCDISVDELRLESHFSRLRIRIRSASLREAFLRPPTDQDLVELQQKEHRHAESILAKIRDDCQIELTRRPVAPTETTSVDGRRFLELRALADGDFALAESLWRDEDGRRQLMDSFDN